MDIEPLNTFDLLAMFMNPALIQDNGPDPALIQDNGHWVVIYFTDIGDLDLDSKIF